jgi:hypothetical protein
VLSRSQPDLSVSDEVVTWCRSCTQIITRLGSLPVDQGISRPDWDRRLTPEVSLASRSLSGTVSPPSNLQYDPSNASKKLLKDAPVNHDDLHDQ